MFLQTLQKGRSISQLQRLIVSSVAVLSLCIPATAVAAGAFSTPSRNIACFAFKTDFHHLGDGLRCTLLSEHLGGGTDPVRTYFYLWSAGPAHRLHSDDDPGGIFPRLSYGKSISEINGRLIGGDRGSVVTVCTSRESGLTCRNRSGHGFTLSRQRQRLF